ncbi:MAG: hypothetical protein AMK69_15825 [Nitrospira bacterium SG8_3]|nr:MAG: hypothetical protein AMK69_15825 [Nitrospira bacterium SG8_3]
MAGDGAIEGSAAGPVPAKAGMMPWCLIRAENDLPKLARLGYRDMILHSRGKSPPVEPVDQPTKRTLLVHN